MYVKPFMAYCIFHEPWLYPNSTMDMMGISMHKAFRLPKHIWGYETIDMGTKFEVCGGNGCGVMILAMW